MDLRTF